MSCPLCEDAGGVVLWRDEFCRVVRAAVEGYPGFCRVILNRHVREMTDLDEREQARLMRVVLACESTLRRLYRPHKVNLASLGNQVPHLHWHVVARFSRDAHFPDAIWGAPRRPGEPPAAVDDRTLASELARAIMQTP